MDNLPPRPSGFNPAAHSPFVPPTPPVPPPMPPQQRPAFAYPTTQPLPPTPNPASQPSRGLKDKKTISVAGLIVTAIVMYGIGLASGSTITAAIIDPGITVVSPGSTTQTSAQESPTGELTQSDDAAPANSDIPAIVENVMPSVVYIEVTGDPTASGEVTGGSGSGFVIREDGYIMTNHHVVEPVGKDGTIDVIFSDGKRFPAEIVGMAPDYDVAVLKIDENNLPAVTLGNSNMVRVGETAIAIGAPLGLDGTVTVGIVSSANRPFVTGDGDAVAVYDSIQTDAAINPGNSGGPLLNSSGSVIGINSAMLTLEASPDPNADPASGNIGLGFAIPINSAKRVAEDIIASGEAITPVMGVSLDMEFTGIGAKIDTISEGSAAEKSGLETGDVVTSINERIIISSDDLVAGVRQYAPGDNVTLTVIRDGKEMPLAVTLGAK